MSSRCQNQEGCRRPYWMLNFWQKSPRILYNISFLTNLNAQIPLVWLFLEFKVPVIEGSKQYGCRQPSWFLCFDIISLGYTRRQIKNDQPESHDFRRFHHLPCNKILEFVYWFYLFIEGHRNFNYVKWSNFWNTLHNFTNFSGLLGFE